ncbi:hypothetical protein ACH5RR_016311 [Cinchona calisaya]|uniref:Uncharacterized protein n=1 Tax=Cinchona calisaya TaxID=153742 RepID=A0ABD2ZYA0_9GENT
MEGRSPVTSPYGHGEAHQSGVVEPVPVAYPLVATVPLLSAVLQWLLLLPCCHSCRQPKFSVAAYNFC